MSQECNKQPEVELIEDDAIPYNAIEENLTECQIQDEEKLNIIAGTYLGIPYCTTTCTGGKMADSMCSHCRHFCTL